MAIVSVIKWDGNPDIFAWKYPDEELGTWTQLIVNESQQAILFKGGQALDVFEAGRHTLSTNNIPFLESIINIPFGGNSPFKAEVWFVNKAFNLDIKWGTPSPIQIKDPTYNIFVPVRSNGIFGIQIDNPKQFLIKLVGTLSSFTKEDILRYFRGLYVSRVKDAISTFILEQEIGVLEINMYLDELSDHLKERIEPIMQEYGIKLSNFFVNDISVPESDPAVIKLRDSLAKKAEMEIIGFDYVQERSFDTLEGAAVNEGSTVAPIMGAGLGMGMGFGMGAGVGGAFSDIASNIRISSNGYSDLTQNNSLPIGTQTSSVFICPRCHCQSFSNQRFCGSCGLDFSTIAKHQNASSPKFCGMCGNAIAPNLRFCPYCGSGIPGSSSSTANQHQIDAMEKVTDGKCDASDETSAPSKPLKENNLSQGDTDE